MFLQKPATAIIDHVARSPGRLFAIVLVLVTLARIALLTASQINLGPDEAQYWFWSLTPEFGYFSKPPMIAWVIGLTTGLFGEGEWAIRLASPLLHGGTALFLYTLGRMLYNPQTGFWIGIGWLLLPAVSIASALISTDSPLLFFWSGALLFLLRMVSFSTAGHAIARIDIVSLGLCLGLGLLSKYAMIYFLIAGTGAIALIPDIRRAALIRALLISLVIMVIVIAPNIWWNMRHDFQTLSHTAANANWQGSLFHPGELLEFLLAQFAMIGPVMAGVFGFGLFVRGPLRTAIARVRQQELILLAFALTPIIIVSTQAFVSRAHVNWAAAAYPAILILATAWMLRAQWHRLLILSQMINLGVAIIFSVAISNFALIDLAGLSNTIKRARGWDIQGVEIARIAADYDVVMADDRKLFSEILYYGAQARRPVMAWDSNNHIDDHYEAFLPFRHSGYQSLLYITENPDAVGVRLMFETITLVDQTSVDLKGGRQRTLYFFSLAGFKG